MTGLKNAVVAGLASALMACSSGQEVSVEHTCSERSALGVEEIAEEGNGHLCDHQNLVASLNPNDETLGRQTIPLFVGQRERRNYCFTDDDGEKHGLTLRKRGGEILLDVVADAPCQELELDRGFYTLEISHENPARDDAASDTMHTRLFADANGLKTFLVASNECPGCDLRKVRWPGNGYGVGFQGNYAGANFSESIALNATGFLGPGNFENTIWDDSTIAASTNVFGYSEQQPGNFRGASFARVKSQRTMSGETAITFAWVNIEHLRFEPLVPRTYVRLGESGPVQMDVDVYRSFQSRPQGLSMKQVRLGAAGEKNFDGLSIDFSPGFTRLNVAPQNGSIDLSGYSFRNAKLKNVRFSWNGDPVNLANAHFQNAQIDGGSFQASNLTNADFSGSILSNFAFSDLTAWSGANINFRNAHFINVELSANGRSASMEAANFEFATFEGLRCQHAIALNSRFSSANLLSFDATGSSFSRSTFDNLQVRNLLLDNAVMNNVSLSLRAGATAVASWSAVNSQWQNATLDRLIAPQSNWTSANLTNAIFRNASLERANFSGARLDGTNFSDALLVSAQFTSARGAAPIFSRAIATNSNFDRADLPGARFDNVNWVGSSAVAAILCGVDAQGLLANRSNLLNALMPAEDETHTVLGEPRVCARMTARDTVVTDVLTRCPNNALGPCHDEMGHGEMWQGSEYPLLCCDPNITTSCETPRQRTTGATCATDCQCRTRLCISGICG